jgi:hypothetical protein
MRAANRMSPRERLVSMVVGILGAIAFVVEALTDKLVKGNTAPLFFAAGFGIGIALIAWRFKNRITVIFAAVAPAFATSFLRGGKANKAPVAAALLAYPFLALVMYLMLKQSKDRRRFIAARIESGEHDGTKGLAPRGRGRKEPEVATEQPDGRPIAAPSKRYTPPKKTSK